MLFCLISLFAGAHILLQRRKHQDEETVGTRHSMAASRSSRVTRSSVGLNGLDENFCGRTLRNRSIAQPEEASPSPLPRARSPKKKQEAKQDAKQEAKQEAKEKPKPEQKEDSKQDAKQEQKPDVRQDAKDDAKRGADEDAKGDSQQDGQHQVSMQGKGKAMDSSASPTELEQWGGSRKRDVSSIGNDVCPEKPENCDRGARSPDPGPPIKRAKRCSRSGDSQGQGDDPELSKPDSAAPAAAAVLPGRDNNCEERLRQNSVKVAPASPVACAQVTELTTAAVAEDGHVECDGPAQGPNAHGASNGLKENQTDDAGMLGKGHSTSSAATAAAPCPSLPNGSQTGAPPSPVPAVPCRSSVSPQVEAFGTKGPEEEPVPKLIVAKQQEVQEVEEVDVVGEAPCLAHEEQVMGAESDSSGPSPTPVEDAAMVAAALTHTSSSPINNSNSGETTPPLVKTPSPTEPACNPSMSNTPPPSFSELYEHRYTLRTSPRRATNGAKASHCRLGSPPRDNGPVGEEGEVVVGGLGDNCPLLEEAAAASDPVGPSSSSLEEEEGEPASMGLEVRAGDEEVVEEEMEGVEEEGEEEEELVKDKEVVERSKEPTLSQAADEEEEEEEPDVYYFESDHLALKHNKE